MLKVNESIRADEALKMSLQLGVSITQFCEINGFLNFGVKSGVSDKKSDDKPQQNKH